jgi:hypothetical protein
MATLLMRHGHIDTSVFTVFTRFSHVTFTAGQSCWQNIGCARRANWCEQLPMSNETAKFFIVIFFLR